jgi:hypothetical protein
VIQIALISRFLIHIEGKLPPFLHHAVTKSGMNCPFKREADFSSKHETPLINSSLSGKNSCYRTVSNQDGQTCPENPVEIACFLSVQQKEFQ